MYSSLWRDAKLGPCCSRKAVQEHDTCMDIVFPRMAWVASVAEVINAIRG